SAGAFQDPPTATPEPTPEPVPLAERLVFGAPYIHRSGVVQTARPLGDEWQVSEYLSNGYSGQIPTVFMINNLDLVVVHHYLRSGIAFETLDTLSTEFLTTAYFAAEWQEYDTWAETARTVTGEAVITDFALAVNDLDFLARDVSSVVESWLVVTRVVVPADSPELLDLLMDEVLARLVVYPQMLALPLGWPIHADQDLGVMLEMPPAMTLGLDVPGQYAMYWLMTGDEAGDHPYVELHALESEVADVRDWIAVMYPDAAIIDAAASDAAAIDGNDLVVYTYVDQTGVERCVLGVLVSGADGPLAVVTATAMAAEVPNWLDESTLPPLYSDVKLVITQGIQVLVPAAE
ncbi:MAG: hypothetical protein GYB65_23965, partial [Chloroflexi bacterium]|nr:hypothetical protein [Chloroflexota bacterium]